MKLQQISREYDPASGDLGHATEISREALPLLDTDGFEPYLFGGKEEIAEITCDRNGMIVSNERPTGNVFRAWKREHNGQHFVALVKYAA